MTIEMTDYEPGRKELTRREFLNLAGVTAGASLVALAIPQGTALAASELTARGIKSTDTLAIPEAPTHPGMYFGKVSLQSPMQIDIPQEFAQRLGHPEAFSATIATTLPQLNKELNMPDIQQFNDAAHHRNEALVMRMSLARNDRHNLLVGHSFYDPSSMEWPFDWVKTAAQLGDASEGQEIRIKQTRSGVAYYERARIVDTRVVSAERFMGSGAKDNKSTEPLIWRSDEVGLGIPTEAFQDKETITFATCTGNFIPQNEEKFTDRAVVTVARIQLKYTRRHFLFRR